MPPVRGKAEGVVRTSDLRLGFAKPFFVPTPRAPWETTGLDFFWSSERRQGLGASSSERSNIPQSPTLFLAPSHSPLAYSHRRSADAVQRGASRAQSRALRGG